MPNKKVRELDRKVVCGFSISCKVKLAFEKKCDELDLNKSHVVEELLKTFIL